MLEIKQNRRKRLIKIDDLVKITFIGIIIVSITITSLLGVFKDKNYKQDFVSLYEKVLEKPLAFGSILEENFNSKFYLKELLIRKSNEFKYILFKTSENSDVLIGKDDWLFRAKDESNNQLLDFKGQDNLSADELKVIKDNLESFNNLAKRYNCNFLITLVPNKYTIYSDYLPNNIKKEKGTNKLTQLSNYLANNSELPLLDLTMALNSEKGNGIIYNKTDLLWNELGAYAGYEELMKKLSLNKDSILNIESVNSVKDKGGILSKEINLEDYLYELKPHLKYDRELDWKESLRDDNRYITVNNKAVFGNLIMMKDEFGDLMQPMLSEHYKKATYINGCNIDEDLIKQNKNSNIILEVSQDNIRSLLSAKVDTGNNGENKALSSLKKPLVISTTLINSNTAVVMGSADEGAEITAAGQVSSTTTKAINGTFLIEVKLSQGASNKVVLSSAFNNLKSEETIINITPNSSVETKPIVVGKDNFMYLTDDVEDIEGKSLFTSTQLEKIKSRLEDYEKYLNTKVKGSKLVLFLAPNKMDIYSEYRPEYIKNSEETKMSQLVKYLKNNSNITIVDSTDILIENKAKELLYYRTDPHWNDLGAFYGYTSLMDSINEFFPKVTPLKLDNFNIKKVSQKGGALTSYLDNKNSFIKEEEVRLLPKFEQKSNLKRPEPFVWLGDTNNKVVSINKDKALPKALVIRDSFTTSMMFYLSESFREVVFCPEWSYKMDKSYIDNEKPDVIIFELVERNLSHLLD